VLVYHAIAFWLPGLGGIAAYGRLRCRLQDAHTDPDAAARASPPHGVTPRFAQPCGARGRARTAAIGDLDGFRSSASQDDLLVTVSESDTTFDLSV
jgi:hypothetical protein